MTYRVERRRLNVLQTLLTYKWHLFLGHQTTQSAMTVVKVKVLSDGPC